ncbi:FAD:protein FMN transferase [Bacteroidales bacterium OttesenSCG-928-J19]|nr:FAD:protein FMN transferase [Bacteroidales bacterium OttesenSCG-928-J19]
MKKKVYIAICCILGCSFLACTQSKKSEETIEVKQPEHTQTLGAGYLHTTGVIFRTNANYKYKFDRSLEPEIEALLDSFDMSLNPFNKQSIIYQVNNNIPVEVDDWFIEVFQTAQRLSSFSGGMYDITAAPLINLWGFGYEATEAPSQQAIDSIRRFVGYQKVRLEGRKVVKDDPRLQLNASSIAKGYAVDVVSELLESYGIGNYMVEIGGEVRAKGLNPKGNPWSIGITKPVDDNTGGYQENQEIIALYDRALATSGNSRNYHVKDGKKFGHTIDPITGYPVQTDILSATVLYSDCKTADAFATAFMVMGLEKAIDLAKRVPGMDYVFIYADKEGNFQSVFSE